MIYLIVFIVFCIILLALYLWNKSITPTVFELRGSHVLVGFYANAERATGKMRIIRSADVRIHRRVKCLNLILTLNLNPDSTNSKYPAV